MEGMDSLAVLAGKADKMDVQKGGIIMAQWQVLLQMAAGEKIFDPDIVHCASKRNKECLYDLMDKIAVA
jgi:hypothetical protein